MEVTPCVGVWIETMMNAEQNAALTSHPAWVCGLKRIPQWRQASRTMSHPAWVCGLKLLDSEAQQVLNKSHPAWVCGLKPLILGNWTVQKCHTLRGCVDWNESLVQEAKEKHVTPCVGVWIETENRDEVGQDLNVTPCVGVWIETENQQKPYTTLWVTPCVGVWIETENILYDFLLS